MNTPHLVRAARLALLASLALACRSGGESPVHPPPVVEPAPEIAVAPEPSASAAANESDDEFVKLLARLGVAFSPSAHTLEVTGWVNMQTGLVEVFACAPQGKTHEAVVVLDCIPSGLHAGLLALGLEPGTPVEFGTGGEYRPPTGDRVEIEVRWRDASGTERSSAAEDWIWDQKRAASMPRAPWIFAGSFLQAAIGSEESNTYAADYIKSLATTYHDASSVLENPHTEGIDDTVYFANEKAVPAVGTPIRAIFRKPR